MHLIIFFYIQSVENSFCSKLKVSFLSFPFSFEEEIVENVILSKIFQIFATFSFPFGIFHIKESENKYMNLYLAFFDLCAKRWFREMH